MCGPDKNSGYVCVACVSQILVDLEKKFSTQISKMDREYYLVRKGKP